MKRLKEKKKTCPAFGRQAGYTAPRGGGGWVEAGRGEEEEGQWVKESTRRTVRPEDWCPRRCTSEVRFKALQACSPLWPLLESSCQEIR